MHVFNTATEQQFDAQRRLERVLASIVGGDVSLACWEPGQTSPFHCHPDATEIYFCCEGGGVMRTPDRSVDVTPGSIIVHPPGEVHEYTNGTGVPCCSVYGMAKTCAHGPSLGPLIRLGSRAPKTPNISAGTP